MLKLLRIPTCQRIVVGTCVAPGIYATAGDGHGHPRLCGRLSVAVFREDDGKERFVCDEHIEAAPAAAESWRLHRRQVAAGPVSRAVAVRRVTSDRPKRPVSAAARANMAAGQQRRWARIREERGLRRAS